MPGNGIISGTDATFGYRDLNTNQDVNFGDVQDWDIKQNKHDLVSRPYNKPPRFAFVPDGFSGMLKILRTGAELENLAIQLINLFNLGGGVKPGYFSWFMNNSDGTVSRRQLTQCVFFLTELGSVSREKPILQSVEIKATGLVDLT